MAIRLAKRRQRHFVFRVAPDTGEFIRNPDGTPRWQRNILYYSVVPVAPNPNEFQGSGIAVDGYEAAYPYKLLVRKESDGASPFSIGAAL